ncbi:response regulator transcription factor [Microlunatus soli]|uniref:DNA-binding response regulator, OmpR family, contains REC and winged-helix (WHTH) domain n=1 Tax=Microlunatus soli TaxID=630515 RepID=A0A1H1TA22_9ACTN|nr:response regulator transcription factor [Microlunatus soli]SDS57110.1 DNA-binding response regulator, OmpR family, contains REC and winged-helix (wHTH) domain [Microlunatus soli]
MADGDERRVAVIIEDDADIANLLAAVLAEAGFESHQTADGVEGIEAIKEYEPILTTLDISLPGIDGFEVARRIREFSSTYIIMLSARTDEIDTLMGLDSGADDYVTKPFRPRELRARVEAMLRRMRRTPGSPLGGEPDPATTGTEQGGEEGGWLSHNGLRMHPQMRLSELDGDPVELTRSEFDLMLAILERQRRVITKNELVLELRGDGSTGGYISDNDRRAVEVHLANLRRKLGDPVGKPRFVQTVRGVGYRLAPDED